MNIRDVIDVDMRTKTIFMRTGCVDHPMTPLEFDEKEFNRTVLSLQKQIASRLDPDDRVESWECNIDGRYSFAKEEKILRRRKGGLNHLQKELDDIKKELIESRK